MLDDLVVDTNVLMHADNPISEHQEAAMTLLMNLQPSAILVCVDSRFDADGPITNSSLILQEYGDRLAPLGLGAAVISILASSGRLKFIGRDVSNKTRGWINREIPNKRDRVFLKVAIKSEERILVSHDMDDFGTSIRRHCRRHFGVAILKSCEICDDLDDWDG